MPDDEWKQLLIEGIRQRFAEKHSVTIIVYKMAILPSPLEMSIDDVSPDEAIELLTR